MNKFKIFWDIFWDIFTSRSSSKWTHSSDLLILCGSESSSWRPPLPSPSWGLGRETSRGRCRGVLGVTKSFLSAKNDWCRCRSSMPDCQTNTSFHVISCHFMSFHVISCHFMSFHVISLQILFLVIRRTECSCKLSDYRVLNGFQRK